MGIKINVGVCKKIGLPDYGSAGSHCDIEIEMDISVLNNTEEFQRRVKHAYGLARESVEMELAEHKPSEQRERIVGNGAAAPDAVQRATLATPPPRTEYRNSAPPERNDNRFQASDKQMKFIGQLCRGIKGLSNRKLDDYCQTTFGKASTQLSAHEASKLIDDLKAAKEGGKGGLA